MPSSAPGMDSTGNSRVDRILAVAAENGWGIEHRVLRYSNSEDTECWTLQPAPNPEGDSITVFPDSNHAAHVLAEIPGYYWAPITQRDALAYMESHPSGPEVRTSAGEA